MMQVIKFLLIVNLTNPTFIKKTSHLCSVMGDYEKGIITVSLEYNYVRISHSTIF